MSTLPSDDLVAQAVVNARLKLFALNCGYATYRGMAKSMRSVKKKIRGKYILLTADDLAFLGALDVFGPEGSLPSTIPLISMIGRRRMRSLGRAGFGLQLVYDRDPKILSGLFIALAEDLK